MKRFTHSFVVDSNIDKVWKFYTNINHLKIITPKRMKIEILDGDNILEENMEYWLKARLITNTKWQSRITRLRPYEYVDEMVGSKFKTWKHLHQFNKIDDNKTEVVDQIDFQLPFGVIGKLFENYAMRKLYEIFEYRKKTTAEALQDDLQI